MVKLSEVDLPVVFKKQLLFKAGHWNQWDINAHEVNKSVKNTDWNKINSSLFYSHKDKDAQAWAGTVKNVYAENGNAYGDVYVWEPTAAVALKFGEAPMAISAGIAWPERFDNPTEFVYRNFNLVTDPGVRDKDIFVNFSSNETKDGYKTASFSAIMDSTSSQGSPVVGNTNTKTADCSCKECNMESCECECHTDKKAEMKKEVKTENYDNANERRSQETITITDIVPSVEERLSTIEAKLAISEGKTEKTAEFDSDKGKMDMAQKLESEMAAKSDTPKTETKPEPVPETKPDVKPSETPSVASEPVKTASPVMGDDQIDAIASKVSDKLLPSLNRPAPMTNHEFGQPAKDPTEDTVEKLASKLSTL